jgi:hypothetical protein
MRALKMAHTLHTVIVTTPWPGSMFANLCQRTIVRELFGKCLLGFSGLIYQLLTNSSSRQVSQ